MDCSIFDRVYAGMLKSASEFQAGNQDETIEYHFDSQLEKVVSKYHLTDVAGQGPDSQKIIRMVEWMTQHCFHNGEFDNHIEPCAEKLLEFSFDHGKENGINCLSLSIALTECLLGLGICARAMTGTTTLSVKHTLGILVNGLWLTQPMVDISLMNREVS